MKQGRIDKIIINSAVLYVVLPIILFLLGWCRWYIGIPCALVMLFCLIKIFLNNSNAFTFTWNRNDIEKMVFIIAIVALWVYFSGIGGFVFQNRDHFCRNAILEMLIKNDWPVIGTVELNGTTQTRGLIYYIGFWLPAAIFGKMFGVKAAYTFLYIWSVLGILFFYYLVCSVRKKIDIWPLVLFIAFSGLDICGTMLTSSDTSVFFSEYHLEWWSIFQFSSFTTQLFWVFNQAIPAWLITMLIMVQKKNRYIVMLLGCSLLSCTFPFIGMLPFACYFMVTREYGNTKRYTKGWWQRFFKDTFTIENVLGGGIAGIFSFLYLIENVSGSNIASIARNMNGAILVASTAEVGITVVDHKQMGMFMLYLVFMLVEVGAYAGAIYKYQKKNALYYVALVWLCICPWIRVGGESDFCMRASIPALIMLYLLVVQTIEKAKFHGDKVILYSLVAILIIGSPTATHEIKRTVNRTYYCYRENIPFTETSATDEEMFTGGNFSGNIEGSFFFHYIGKE